MKWVTASTLVLSGFLIVSPVLAQARPCSDLSRDNPTLYRPEGGAMHCLDWNQATCSYEERPCRLGELGVLCFYIPATCSWSGGPRATSPPGPGASAPRQVPKAG